MVKTHIGVNSFDEIGSFDKKILYLTLKDKDIPNTMIRGVLNNLDNSMIITFDDVVKNTQKTKIISIEEMKNTFKPLSYVNVLVEVVDDNVTSHPDTNNPF